MIIVKISDGFGNQLFMYACGYAVAKRLNTKLMLDISFLETNKLRNYELDKLNINCDRYFTTKSFKSPFLKILCRKIFHKLLRVKYTIYREKQHCFYDDATDKIENNTYLFGYFQTEKYFKNYRMDLLRMFTPKYPLSEDCRQYIRYVQSCNSVAVHIRRGDYVRLGICLNASYYQKAFEFIEKRIKGVIYFVFSDDLDYAKSMLKSISQSKFEYIEYDSKNQTIDDFFIMKSCKHIIMANSTYSWWAAWLNDNPNKIVIYSNPKINSDFYPEKWIGIPNL